MLLGRTKAQELGGASLSVGIATGRGISIEKKTGISPKAGNGRI